MSIRMLLVLFLLTALAIANADPPAPGAPAEDVFYRKALTDGRELVVRREGRAGPGALSGLYGGVIRWKNQHVPDRIHVVPLPESHGTPPNTWACSAVLELRDAEHNVLPLWAHYIGSDDGPAPQSKSFAVLDMLAERNGITMVVVMYGALQVVRVGLGGHLPHDEYVFPGGWMNANLVRSAEPGKVDAHLTREANGDLRIDVTDKVADPPKHTVFRMDDVWTVRGLPPAASPATTQPDGHFRRVLPDGKEAGDGPAL